MSEPPGPLIGITTYEDEDNWWLPQAYAQSIAEAGGHPVLLPSLRNPEPSVGTWIERLDGLLLPGGGDLAPETFGQEPRTGLGSVAPDRDATELAVTRAALAADLPLFAICRGIQVLNVAAGGDLYQDLDRELAAPLQHMQEAPRHHLSHSVWIPSDTRLATLIGSGRTPVNSFHHQAVRRVAPGFRVSARAPDGVVEAIEAPDRTLTFGVQWHPEALWRRHARFQALFTALVEAARSSHP